MTGDVHDIDWFEVCNNFWYACEHGDADLMDHLCDKYADYFIEDNDDE